MQIIGLTGYAGAGKDEAAKGLIGLGWERLSFATPVYEGVLAIDPTIPIGHRESAALGTTDRWRGYTWTGNYALSELVAVFGWDRLKRAVPEVRRLLQRYGTEAGRHIHGEDCWIKLLGRKMQPGVSYVVTDVRFPNEAAEIHHLGGKVVRIHRPGVVAVNDHDSDRIESIPVDLCITNAGAPWELKSELVKYATAEDEALLTVAGQTPEQAHAAFTAALADRAEEAYEDDDVHHPLYERRGPRAHGGTRH